MSAATYPIDITNNVVSTFLLDADLAPNTGLFGKIEPGLVEDLSLQDILGPEMPYGGVSVRSQSDDSPSPDGAEVGFTSHVLDVEVDMCVVDANQRTAEDKIRQMCATVNRRVAIEKKSANRFGMNDLSDPQGHVDDVYVGRWLISPDVRQAPSDTSFLVRAKYTFRVLYRMVIP